MLIDAPIAAEYWIAELITVKRELAKEYAGKNKIIVAGGSSTLFSVNAEYASEKLDMPMINYGLHAGLSLRKILQEASSIVEPGDLLILMLEPSYYECNEKLNIWNVENIIGWDHAAWEEMDYLGKTEFIFLVSPSVFSRMVVAAFQRKFFPAKVKDRIATLDKSLVLSRFKARPRPLNFEYSAYHLDNHGDMLRAEGEQIEGPGSDVSKPNHICAGTANQLINFVGAMKMKGVHIYFANTPYIASGVSMEKVKRDELNFQKEFITVGCFIDRREDLIFDRRYFFNSNLHLNTEGRAVRTDLLIDAIRNMPSGNCQHLPLHSQENSAV